MENIENEIMRMIERFGATEFQNQLDIVMNRMTPANYRDEANLKITEYMAMDGMMVGSQKRLVKNVIITSPTQLGKTKYIIDACKRNENNGELIVISCDNSNVQLSQLKGRLTEAGVRNYPVTKASSSVVGGLLKNKKTVVIVMLNNSSQVSKLTKLITDIRFVNDPARYIFFHDEADMLNKSDSVNDLANGSVPVSHRYWVGLMDFLEKTCIPTNRFWVSATPENCSSISRIVGKDILVLPDDNNYRGISGHTSWHPDAEDAGDLLDDEIERIREIGVEMSGEVILYCVDRKNEEQDVLARELSDKYNCVTCSYNMKNMILYFDGSVVRGVIGKKDNIATVLDKTREFCISENAPMVIVGYNLMSRGVSFVAEGYNPPTATVMFYSGGVGSHVVGLSQRFGRITGTARPDLVRRHLYCSDAVYNDYTGYLKNQKIAWDALSDVGNAGLDICSILLGCSGSVKLNRPLDRPGLVNVNNSFKEVGVVRRGSGEGEGEYDENKMHRLVDSWKVVTNTTAIARLFRRMLDCEGKMESGIVREMIPGQGPYDSLTSNHMSRWNSVFRKDGRYHYIRDEVMEYLG
jgi:hypothetical protein